LIFDKIIAFSKDGDFNYTSIQGEKDEEPTVNP